MKVCQTRSKGGEKGNLGYLSSLSHYLFFSWNISTNFFMQKLVSSASSRDPGWWARGEHPRNPQMNFGREVEWDALAEYSHGKLKAIVEWRHSAYVFMSSHNHCSVKLITASKCINLGKCQNCNREWIKTRYWVIYKNGIIPMPTLKTQYTQQSINTLSGTETLRGNAERRHRSLRRGSVVSTKAKCS